MANNPIFMPSSVDPDEYRRNLENAKQDRLEERIVRIIYSRTVGLPKHIKNDPEKMTCDQLNQYSDITFMAYKFESKKTLFHIVSGMWKASAWPAAHKPEIEIMSDTHAAAGGTEWALCTQYAQPLAPVVYHYAPDAEYQEYTRPHLVFPVQVDTDERVLVRLMRLDDFLDMRKEMDRPVLRSEIRYEN